MTQHASARLMRGFDEWDLIMTVASGDLEWIFLEGASLSFNKRRYVTTRQRKSSGAGQPGPWFARGALIENRPVLENPY